VNVLRGLTSTWDLALLIYVAGVLLGLIVIDARPAAKIGLAILWPLGPLAFAVTIAILFFAALIAFPVFGVTVVAVAGVLWLYSL
jgi:hypothetical protein